MNKLAIFLTLTFAAVAYSQPQCHGGGPRGKAREFVFERRESRFERERLETERIRLVIAQERWREAQEREASRHHRKEMAYWHGRSHRERPIHVVEVADREEPGPQVRFEVVFPLN